MIGPVTVPDWPPGTVAILTTVAADGAPHAIPVSTALRIGPRTVMLALAPEPRLARAHEG